MTFNPQVNCSKKDPEDITLYAQGQNSDSIHVSLRITATLLRSVKQQDHHDLHSISPTIKRKPSRDLVK